MKDDIMHACNTAKEAEITALYPAAWIEAEKLIEAPIIEKKFYVSGARRASIKISSLGFFRLYINGVRVGDEYFLPSNSIYHKRCFKSITYPINDEFTYRCYYSVYDIGEFLQDGENKLEIILGNGWYRQIERIAEGDMSFGEALSTIFLIEMEDNKGRGIVCSDGSEMCRESFITYSNLFYGETQDFRVLESKGELKPVKVISVDAVLSREIAPPDREIKKITPACIYDDGDRRIYDAGENISGFASMSLVGCPGDKISVRYAENINGCKLDFESTGASYIGKNGKKQIMTDVFISDGKERLAEPYFTWHTFRYFEIIGDASAVCVKVIHSDVRMVSAFNSSSEELNWLYRAFVRTQLDNMHGGVPSDCPHRERLGYTGDGQICAPSAMLMLDAEDFYRKWITDIFDSQDSISGHVNHTAPFAGGGGGPGGWGMAAITVPYNYYKAYGDKEPLFVYYGRMKKWVEYLVAHSEGGLVVREEEGGWCLGDWSSPEPTIIAEDYVNTCLFIKALELMSEIAQIVGRHGDVSEYEKIKEAAVSGVTEKYFDSSSGSFANGIQGADAYALYVGMGDERTVDNLKSKYNTLGRFDTGFIGTAVLCEALLTNNGEDVLYKLMTSQDVGGYGYFLKHGMTTLPESWQMGGSHCHPMFGAPAGYLFCGFLGIENDKGSCGYKNIKIAPKIPSALDFAEGHIENKLGRLNVRWQRDGASVLFEISLSGDVKAMLEYGGMSYAIRNGMNKFIVKGER